MTVMTTRKSDQDSKKIVVWAVIPKSRRSATIIRELRRLEREHNECAKFLTMLENCIAFRGQF